MSFTICIHGPGYTVYTIQCICNLFITKINIKRAKNIQKNETSDATKCLVFFYIPLVSRIILILLNYCVLYHSYSLHREFHNERAIKLKKLYIIAPCNIVIIVL